MAHWYKKPNRAGVPTYVTVVSRRRPLSRKEWGYHHLDGATDAQIDAWVRSYELANEDGKGTPAPRTDRQLIPMMEAFAAHMTKMGKAPSTVSGTQSYLRRYCLPFFLGKGLTDPQTWPPVSVQLLTFLQALDCSQTHIQAINNALRWFFRYLQEEGTVAWEGELRLRNTPKIGKKTPLRYTLKPEQVLKFADDAVDDEIKLLALAGFFLGLRSQESMALTAADFRAGQLATHLECAKANLAAGLYDRLVVHVTKQQRPDRSQPEPKAHSRGWVACFDAAAARRLVELLNRRPKVAAGMVGKDNRGVYRRWWVARRGTALAKISLKSLRRAAIYHLGHWSRLDAVGVQRFARHKQASTTEAYLRRPEEVVEPTAPGTFEL